MTSSSEAHCADPAYLPLVDAAIDHPRSDAARFLREQACPACPLAQECLDIAMGEGHWGVWGGTTATARVRAGAPTPKGWKEGKPRARVRAREQGVTT